MKLKIHIQFKTEPANTTAQKPPIDRRKILLFITMLMTPAALWASYYCFDENYNATTAERVKQPLIAPGVVGASSDRVDAEQPLELLESLAATVTDGAEVDIAMIAPGVVGASSDRVNAEQPLELLSSLAAQVTDGAEVILPVANNEKQQVTGQLEPHRVDFSANIVRTVLTSGIASREPVDDLGLVISGKVEQKIYLFSEVRGMTGQQIIHRWLLNDRVMANIKLSIGGERWRTYSSKIITPGMTGHWRIEVTNNAGQLLAAHNFDNYH